MCFVIWPSSILKLTMVQGCIYRVHVRDAPRGVGWNMRAGAWRLRFQQVPADMDVSVCVAVGLSYCGVRRACATAAVLLVRVLLTMAIFRNTSEARYIAPSLPST